jgi:metal-sulfur cluster biosynthetic enzyme
VLADESTVRDALREVEDPEAGMNIVDLGLVYAVEVKEDAVRVDITMTSPACPVADVLTEQVHDAVAAAVPPGTDVSVRLVWEPIWHPSMMSGVAKDHFGWG